jgi:hypothetical protein
MHQWIDPSPVDEPMPPQERQPRAIDARPQWIEPDTMHQWVEAGPVTEDLPQGGGPPRPAENKVAGARQRLSSLAEANGLTISDGSAVFGGPSSTPAS